MEVLNEKQQLNRRLDELNKSMDYQDGEIRKKEDYISNYEGRWIFYSNGTLRVLRYELASLKQIYADLKEYRTVILLRIREIDNNKNT